MINDAIKFKNGKYICTIYLYPGITGVSRSALENFLFLKWYTESIECYVFYDYEYRRYSLRLVGKSLTNILRARFEIVNYFIKVL
jgi:hypothetical protein